MTALTLVCLTRGLDRPRPGLNELHAQPTNRAASPVQHRPSHWISCWACSPLTGRRGPAPAAERAERCRPVPDQRGHASTCPPRTPSPPRQQGLHDPGRVRDAGGAGLSRGCARWLAWAAHWVGMRAHRVSVACAWPDRAAYPMMPRAQHHLLHLLARGHHEPRRGLTQPARRLGLRSFASAHSVSRPRISHVPGRGRFASISRPLLGVARPID